MLCHVQPCFITRKWGSVNPLPPTRFWGSMCTACFWTINLQGKTQSSSKMKLLTVVWLDSKGKGHLGKTSARNMLRKCLKHSQWPQIYVAEIRTFHPKMQIEILQDMAFILPHELLFALGDFNSVDTLTTLDGAATSVKNHCQAAAELLQCPLSAMVLWCDGTPFNWERTKSLELLLINFPGLSESNKTWRFPVAAVPHEHVSKHATFEDIFQIMAWSFQQCLIGTMPNTRHDGLQFNSTDSWRKKKQSNPCWSQGWLEMPKRNFSFTTLELGGMKG